MTAAKQLQWTTSNRVWTARPDGSAPYYITYSGGLHKVTLGSGTLVGGSANLARAVEIAQRDYENRLNSRQNSTPSIQPDQLIAAMRATIDDAWANLKDAPAVAVTVAIEQVAKAVGVDPALLRSERRP